MKIKVINITGKKGSRISALPIRFEKHGENFRCDLGCLNGYEFKSNLGQGSFGVVYSLRRGGKLINKVAKIVMIDVPIPDEDCIISNPKTNFRKDCGYNSLEGFMKEVKMHRAANQKGFGPQIHEAWICDRFYHPSLGQFKAGIIVMDRWDTTLEAYKDQHPAQKKALWNMAKELATKMKAAKLAHYDLHAGNIMLRLDKDDKIKHIGPIDFAELKQTADWDFKQMLKTLWLKP
jgi:hypothetical protein